MNDNDYEEPDDDQKEVYQKTSLEKKSLSLQREDSQSKGRPKTMTQEKF